MVVTESCGSHTFSVYLPDAASVELVGSFTDWRGNAVRMVREGTGWWVASLRLPEGEHDFSYLVNGATWLPDYAAYGVRRNGFGGWVSQVHVAHGVREAEQRPLTVVVPRTVPSSTEALVEAPARGRARAA